MAIKPEDYYVNANTATPSYPHGSIKNDDVPGDNSGTLVDAALQNDMIGFGEALMIEAGVTLSGAPDTALSSDRLTALKKIVRTSNVVFDYSEMISKHSTNPYSEGQVVTVTGEGISGEFSIKKETSHGYTSTTGVLIKLDDDYYALRIYDSEIIVDWFVVDGTRTTDSNAIRNALNYASGAPVKLLPHRYMYDGVTISLDNVRIIGSAMPQINVGKTALENGSIIDGSFTFVVQNAEFKDFGVDCGSDSDCDDGDSLRASAPTLNSGGHLHTENIIALNKSPSTVQHALLFQSYQTHTSVNLIGIYSLFGFVSKCMNVHAVTTQTYGNDESGFLIKSDTGFGTAGDINVADVVCEGVATQRRGVHIQSSTTSVRDVIINGIRSSDCDENVLIQIGSSGTDLRNINIRNITSKNSRDHDVLVDNLKGTAVIFNVVLENVVTEGTLGRGLTVRGNGSTNHIRTSGLFINYEASVTQSVMDDSVFFGANCKSTDIDNVTIIRNFSNSMIGGVNYNNIDVDNQVLGTVTANVFGLYRPQPGVSEPEITGIGNDIVIPRNNKGEAYSCVRVAPLAALTEINSFSPPRVGAYNFQKGHRLSVINNSIFATTINHNPSSGIYNRGGVAVSLPANEVVTYIFGGSDTWHQSSN